VWAIRILCRLDDQFAIHDMAVRAGSSRGWKQGSQI